MAYGQEHIEPELLDWIDSIPAGSVFTISVPVTESLLFMRRAQISSYYEPGSFELFLLAFNNYLNSKLNDVKVEACLILPFKLLRCGSNANCQNGDRWPPQDFG